MLLMIGQSHSSQMLAFQRPRTFDLAAQRPDLAAMTVQIQELTLSAAQTLTPVSLAGRTQSLAALDRKSTRLNSSYDQISYAVFCLKKKKHTSELQSRSDLVCRLLLEKKKNIKRTNHDITTDH